ncbi:DUF4416 family protein [Candidatus Woesearchaeota archaeon]|nr:DUF4416 family protein [Candidatus Woesearchaeota archaeon]
MKQRSLNLNLFKKLKRISKIFFKMAVPTLPPKAKLVIGVMFSETDIFLDCKKYLVKKFGKTDFESKVFDFSFTDYYNQEMGQNLKKIFLGFEKLICISKLPEIKIFSNKLEKQFSEEKNRKINIDPGYLTKEKLIVASCKSRPHRIYLGKGVYAHLMFIFKRDDVIKFKWTYADYIQEKEFFLKLRTKLLQG